MAKVINQEIVKDIPWEDRPEGHFLPLWRYSKNPVIGRCVNNVIDRAYNSAFVPWKDGYIGVFRGEKYNSVPLLFVGRSKDGLHFDIDEEPIHFVDENGKPLADTPWQYDPRVVKVEDWYYVIWADNFNDVACAMARTKDFKTFTKMSYPFLPNNRNGVLFPRKINGKYYMLSRPSDNDTTMFGNIFISESPDLKYWGNHKLLLRPGWSWWNMLKVGAGPAPIETDEGWLLFIHGVIRNVNTVVYSIGGIILDKDDPSKVKYCCDNFFMMPSESYEISGFTPNVCFPTCVIPGENGRLAVYYGAADTYTCLAFTTVDTIVNYIKDHAVKK